jgi:acetyl-CoA decarbonylase/synthase complex subunit gamma
MALTGLSIFKLLPKTNCKKCGQPTCLAFAMQLAQKKVNLSQCPDISEAGKKALEGASAPPIRLVAIGEGAKKLQVGQENVLFRHEEKFYRPPGVALTLEDDLDEAAFKARLDKINNLKFTRVGTQIEIDLVAVVNKSGKADAFASAAQAVAGHSPLNIILMSESPEAMKAAVAVCGAKKPLIAGATAANLDAMTAIAKAAGCAIAVRANTLDELADLTQKIKAAGVEDIVLDVSNPDPKRVVQDLTKVRRAGLKRGCRPLGYPCMAVVKTADPYEEIAQAGTFVAKYAGIVVLNGTEPWQIIPILTLRQNIYTDPQKPIQVEAKLYAVGEANENSPLLFTTNFSLTYYTVEGDVEASRIPAWILAINTEGTSVLTAYSGDKLNEKIVAKAIKDAKVEEKVKHRKLIIPGYVAVMSGKLEEELPGWEILVGPKESSVLPSYLKTVWGQQK